MSRSKHSRKNRGLRLESLERRRLLAGDFVAEPSPDTPAIVSVMSSNAEGEQSANLVEFARELANSGTIFYGAGWCPACTLQKELFEDGGSLLPFIEVTNPDRSLNSIGTQAGLDTFPTWEFPNGSQLKGVQTIETLSQMSGVPIPTNDSPSFKAINDQAVLIGSPLHVPIDAYSPDGSPLTVTTTVADPSLLEATVVSGNRSLRITVEGFGDMVFELFEQRAPNSTGRVIELAESDFYEGITFHRVIDDFVIQAGDPTGTGASGSTLGDFDDDYHPDLQHNREGVLSFAKAGDDTNNSQFFIGEVPLRYLDFNHGVFGQLVEGFDVRDAISNQSTGTFGRPDIDIVIERMEVFQDIENSVVMLKPTGVGTGETTVTFTVTDADGNSYTETVQVEVKQDTANSQPFLAELPEIVHGNQLQLSSIDVEGDPVLYFATSLTNGASAGVDPVSGLVTVVTTSGFQGTVDVQVGVRPGSGVSGNASSDQDTQVVSFVVDGQTLPSSQLVVDLLDSSDSGRFNDDNVTNQAELVFRVDGATDGATVEIVDLNRDVVIGVGVASDSHVQITTLNIAASGEGTYRLAAREIINGQVGEFSTAIMLVYDTTAPDPVVSTATLNAVPNEVFVADVSNASDDIGLIYSLASSPTGASIDPHSGVIRWIPTTEQEGFNPFELLVADPAGNQRLETFAVVVGDQVISNDLVGVELRLTDLSGQPINSIQQGQSFLVNVVGKDLRAVRDGVFSIYADLFFDESLVRATEIIFDGDFTFVQQGEIEDGLINELGAVTNRVTASMQFESLIAKVRMEAIGVGVAQFTSDPADEVNNEVLLFGSNELVTPNLVDYGGTELVIGSGFSSADEQVSVELGEGETLSIESLDGDDIVTVYVRGDNASAEVKLGVGDDRLRLEFGDHNPTIEADGGDGFDTLEFVGSDHDVTLADFAAGLSNLEAIEFGGSGANRLTISANDVIQVTDAANELVVSFGIDDEFNLVGQWTSEGVALVDGQVRHRFTQSDSTLIVISGLAWQNPRDATDVDGNGETEASDALQIINRLIRLGSGVLPLAGEGSLPDRYYDVSGDGRITAIDALHTINELTRRTALAEGEAFTIRQGTQQESEEFILCGNDFGFGADESAKIQDFSILESTSKKMDQAFGEADGLEDFRRYE